MGVEHMRNLIPGLIHTRYVAMRSHFTPLRHFPHLEHGADRIYFTHGVINTMRELERRTGAGQVAPIINQQYKGVLIWWK